MPVIRNEQAKYMAPRTIALELEDVRTEADEILARARAEAAAIEARARAESEQLRVRILEEAAVEGDRRGFQEGQERGRAEAMEKVYGESIEPHRALLEQLGPAWVEQVTRFGEERETLIEDARRELLTLAIELARRVVHRTIEVDETACIDQVAHAIQLLGVPRELRVMVCPSDREVLDRALPGVLEQARVTGGVEVIESDEISPGGCIVSAGEGSVDARVETQLDRIAEALVPGAAS